MSSPLSNADYDQLRQRGISPEEADRQLKILQRRVTLIQPCTPSEGIEMIPESELAELASLHKQSAEAGRWLKLVPASGAASRMFALKSQEDRQRLCQRLNDFAFSDALESSLRDAGSDLSELLEQGAFNEIVDHLLKEPGLNCSNQPKGLLLFHRYSTGTRTPFEEHLREAAGCFHSGDGRCRVHFTVSEEHREQFDALLEQLRPIIASELQSEVDVNFSLQKPSTDTLALADDDSLARDGDGNILLRPGGHGALLENLNDLQGDLIFIKNIDNVCHERLQGPTRTWIQTLGGYLVRLQEEVHRHLRELGDGGDQGSLRSAEEFVNEQFPNSLGQSNGDSTSRRDEVLQVLNRPIRVCGMVRNEGEPGGGPFWVRGAGGSASVQIVESAEIEPSDESQQKILGKATHFNPVFMALAIRDHQGRPFNLPDFVNEDRYILTKKQSEGKTVRALERPGLWNGSMAHWNSVFVEVPKEVFSPVKTVFDLLRDAHQAVPTNDQ